MPDNETVTLQFEGTDPAETFRIEPAKRTITGLAVPWGAVATSGGKQWRFSKGSLQWGVRESRVKLNLQHDHNKPIGVATSLVERNDGLEASFKIASGTEGDLLMAHAQEGILDGFSIEVDFQRDSYAPDPHDKSINNVQSALLRGVALTHEPAFDGARIERIAAREDKKVATKPVTREEEEEETQDPNAEFRQTVETGFTRLLEHQEQQIEKLGETFSASIVDAFESMNESSEDRHVPRAARIRFTNDPPVYQYGRLGVNGDSLVKDAYYAAVLNDPISKARFQRYSQQQENLRKQMQQASWRFAGMQPNAQFTTVTTANVAEVVPPGYRPDLYVPELFQGRPFTDRCSRGTIDNASPFTVPVFTSATATTGPHTEGTNPTDGAIDLSTKTVAPGPFSGIMNLSREIVDSSNPAIDAIVLTAMREEYARDTEARAYTEFNSATLGLGGTITAGFVPSGAQASATAGTAAASNRALLAGIRAALAVYQFRRFLPPNQGVLSQEAVTLLAGAVDTTERPLLASVGAMNAAGVSNARNGTYNIDGLDFGPAWSITGNAAGDFDVAMWNQSDVWVFESPLLTFQYSEKLGPAMIQLALFGYYGIAILRPVGLSGVRHTHTP